MACMRPSWVLCIACHHNRAMQSKGSICKECRTLAALGPIHHATNNSPCTVPDCTNCTTYPNGGTNS